MPSFITLGVLSDTHIPDRERALHPGILPIFEQAGVSTILHGGDITVPSVIAELEQLAPVKAVKGNRDWLFNSSIPPSTEFEVGGIRIGLAHGHGSYTHYLVDKVKFAVEGYRLTRYRKFTQGLFPDARVIVFGHTHRLVNQWIGEQLFFNPGPAGVMGYPGLSPSVGLLRIYPGGEVSGEIILLSPIRGKIN